MLIHGLIKHHKTKLKPKSLWCLSKKMPASEKFKTWLGKTIHIHIELFTYTYRFLKGIECFKFRLAQFHLIHFDKWNLFKMFFFNLERVPQFDLFIFSYKLKSVSLIKSWSRSECTQWDWSKVQTKANDCLGVPWPKRKSSTICFLFKG